MIPALLLRYWKPLAIVVALWALAIGGWLYVRHVDHSARAEQKAADTAAVTLAQSQAHAADLERVRTIEAANAAKKEKADDSLAPALADARAALARYVRLHTAAAQGAADGVNMPSTSEAAAIIVGSDQNAVLADDLDVCTENTVRLANAAAWARETLKP